MTQELCTHIQTNAQWLTTLLMRDVTHNFYFGHQLKLSELKQFCILCESSHMCSISDGVKQSERGKGVSFKSEKRHLKVIRIFKVRINLIPQSNLNTLQFKLKWSICILFHVSDRSTSFNFYAKVVNFSFCCMNVFRESWAEGPW